VYSHIETQTEANKYKIDIMKQLYSNWEEVIQMNSTVDSLCKSQPTTTYKPYNLKDINLPKTVLLNPKGNIISFNINSYIKNELHEICLNTWLKKSPKRSREFLNEQIH